VFFMDNDSQFRKPVFVDVEGLYLTQAQLQFFLNRRKGYEHIKKNSPQFKEYFSKCLIYNFVWDLMESDPSVAQLCWDVKSETVVLKFPHNGIIMRELSRNDLLGPINIIEDN